MVPTSLQGFVDKPENSHKNCIFFLILQDQESQNLGYKTMKRLKVKENSEYFRISSSATLDILLCLGLEFPARSLLCYTEKYQNRTLLKREFPRTMYLSPQL